MAIMGIDVSHYQGTIDWNKVAQTKEFAILKCSQGQKSDPNFSSYYSGASSHLAVGAYVYVRATNFADAVAESNFAVQNLSGKKMQMGVWLDIEDKTLRVLGTTKLTTIICIEANILKKNGYQVGIYCNRDWYQNVLNSTELKKYFPFWIARYPYNDYGEYNDASTLNTRGYSVAWQYSSKGKVDGINANVDLDALFVPINQVFTSKARIGNIPSIALPTVEKDMRGVACKLLQEDLRFLGYVGEDGKPLALDGEFGKNSVFALKDFQFENMGPNEADGIYGKKTYAKMKTLLG